MSISDLSVLEHLRWAAVKLNINYEIEQSLLDISLMQEGELASIINQHYQDHKIEDWIRQGGEKRKLQLECRNSKKLKVCNQKIIELSEIEKLPNEIYEKILNYGDQEDMKNLRIASKWLYEKTTLMCDIFHDWYLNVSRGLPPDFVLMSDQNFFIHVNFNLKEDKVDTMGNFINRYAKRISYLEVINYKSESLNKHLKSMKPAEFPYLTSLQFYCCKLDNESLILLAPQLKELSLIKVISLIDLSSVSENDECFTKLKVLTSAGCNIQIKKILTKCFSTLEYLYLGAEECEQFDDFNPELSSLKHMDIVLTSGSEQSVTNLLSRASRRLITLCFYVKDSEDDHNFDLSNLLQQTMNISTLELRSYEAKHIDKFLNKCPLIQNLTLKYYEEDVGEVVLKDLIDLTLYNCKSKCIQSILNKASRSSMSLRALKIKVWECLESYELPVIHSLDTVWIDSDNPKSKDLAQVSKLFPENTKINFEVLDEYETVYRKVYDSL